MICNNTFAEVGGAPRGSRVVGAEVGRGVVEEVIVIVDVKGRGMDGGEDPKGTAVTVFVRTDAVAR